jgi:hypothetical protein
MLNTMHGTYGNSLFIKVYAYHTYMIDSKIKEGQIVNPLEGHERYTIDQDTKIIEIRYKLEKLSITQEFNGVAMGRRGV